MLTLVERASPILLETLLDARRTLICVGAGGVGKTTVSAALGVAAARRGRRVLALTIDPARRLSQSLGLGPGSSEPERVPAQELGLEPDAPGGLWVSVLDVKATFDALVSRYVSDPGAKDRILSSRLYLEMAGSLPGTQEYMAMDSMLRAHADPRFDLLIVDTPPAQNALDFFSAPDRMLEALDGSAMRWVLHAFAPPNARGLGRVTRQVASALHGLSRITGAEFLDQTAALLFDLQTAFGGFRQRAAEARRAFQSPDVACLLVTRPEALALSDAQSMRDTLQGRGIGLSAWIVNQCEALELTRPSESEVLAELARRGTPMSPEYARAVLAAVDDCARVARHQRELLQSVVAPEPMIEIPRLVSRGAELESVRAIAASFARPV